MSAIPPGAREQVTAGQGGYSQYLRKWSVLVSSSSTGQGTILSQSDPPAGFDLRFECQTTAADYDTPGICICTVYNLNYATSLKIINEYDILTIQAGYLHGKYGVIFKGTCKQFQRGRNNQTDSFLKIFAADWDFGFTRSTINTTLPPGWTWQQLQAEHDRQWAQHQMTAGYRDKFITAGQNSRSRVVFGMGADEQHDLAASTNMVFSVEDGKVKLMRSDRSTNLPLPPIQLNQNTGLINWPTVTNEGIQFRCLLNPALKIGGIIQLNNREIQSTSGPGGAQFVSQFPGFQSGVQFFADANSTDGFYRVLYREHSLDSRGNAWWSDIVATAHDPT